MADDCSHLDQVRTDRPRRVHVLVRAHRALAELAAPVHANAA